VEVSVIVCGCCLGWAFNQCVRAGSTAIRVFRAAQCDRASRCAVLAYDVRAVVLIRTGIARLSAAWCRRTRGVRRSRCRWCAAAAAAAAVTSQRSGRAARLQIWLCHKICHNQMPQPNAKFHNQMPNIAVHATIYSPSCLGRRKQMKALCECAALAASAPECTRRVPPAALSCRSMGQQIARCCCQSRTSSPCRRHKSRAGQPGHRGLRASNRHWCLGGGRPLLTPGNTPQRQPETS
jgi:hypothetical protein